MSFKITKKSLKLVGCFLVVLLFIAMPNKGFALQPGNNYDAVKNVITVDSLSSTSLNTPVIIGQYTNSDPNFVLVDFTEGSYNTYYGLAMGFPSLGNHSQIKINLKVRKGDPNNGTILYDKTKDSGYTREAYVTFRDVYLNGINLKPNETIYFIATLEYTSYTSWNLDVYCGDDDRSYDTENIPFSVFAQDKILLDILNNASGMSSADLTSIKNDITDIKNKLNSQIPKLRVIANSDFEEVLDGEFGAATGISGFTATSSTGNGYTVLKGVGATIKNGTNDTFKTPGTKMVTIGTKKIIFKVIAPPTTSYSATVSFGN